MIKVRVEELRYIPASLVISEGDDFQSECHLVGVVILQQSMIGTEARDEDPIDPHGNPHPVPQQPHFHPNQHNHFLRTLQDHEHDDFHQEQIPDLNQNNNLVNLELAL
ncbi:rRNA N-glycosidase [Hordeum vulgare]|nr:rRNA N-glycosidase [Hordeum vulgare]